MSQEPEDDDLEPEYDFSGAMRGKYYQQDTNVILLDSDVAPQWQRDLLDERLASSESEEGRDWEDLKAEVWPADR